MKLSEKAKKAITTKTRNKLALELGCSVYTIGRWITDNESNGDLTKAKAVEIISQETAIPVEEVLVEVPQPQS